MSMLMPPSRPPWINPGRVFFGEVLNLPQFACTLLAFVVLSGLTY